MKLNSKLAIYTGVMTDDEAERALRAERQREYYLRNRDRIQVQRRGNYDRRREEIRIRRATYHRRLKRELLAGYGQRCACCGEEEERFLSLDHVNGGGAAHRRQIGSAPMVWLDAIKRGFPADYQILCFNCNLGRHLNGGICPHQDSMSASAA